MPGPADDGWEDGPRGVVSGETGLAHPGTIVNYEGSNIVVTHLACFWFASTPKWHR